MQEEKRCEFKLAFKDKDGFDDWKMTLKTTEPKTEAEIISLIDYYAEVNERNNEGDYSPVCILDDLCEEKGWSWEDRDFDEIKIIEW